MKKINVKSLMRLAIASCLTVGLVACQEFTIDSQPETPANIQIDALDQYSMLATSPSSVTFNISANVPWTISCQEQWCTVTPSMSASSSLVSEIVVSAEDNTTAEARTATLTIAAEGISGTKVVTIVQASKENLVVIPYDEAVKTEGGTISFNIISNKPWQIIPSTQFIESIDKTSGEGDESGDKIAISITVPANPGVKRSGKITVKTDYEAVEFAITQDGVIIEQEKPEDEKGTISLAGAGGEKTVSIRANKEWTVKVPEEFKSWLSAEAASASELKVCAVRPNPLMVPRVGYVLLSTKEIFSGFEDIKFPVSQGLQYSFTGNQEDRVVDETTGYVKMSAVGSNQIVSNYGMKKGMMKIDFDEMKFAGNTVLFINMYTERANFNIEFSNSKINFRIGGGFSWNPIVSVANSPEEMAAIRTIGLEIADDPASNGKIIIRLYVNDVLKGVQAGRTDIFTADPSYAGQPLYLQWKTPAAGDYYVIKSVSYEEYK